MPANPGPPLADARAVRPDFGFGQPLPELWRGARFLYKSRCNRQLTMGARFVGTPRVFHNRTGTHPLTYNGGTLQSTISSAGIEAAYAHIKTTLASEFLALSDPLLIRR